LSKKARFWASIASLLGWPGKGNGKRSRLNWKAAGSLRGTIMSGRVSRAGAMGK
jgi:hypothetical protein